MKQSGGQVIVDSEVGQGATFTLYLPRVIAAPGVAAPEEEATEVGSGTCVLVVEDNRDVGTFVTQTLGELGYSTKWVENAQAALDELARSPGAHDILFSDVVMPGMNGVELARHVQRLYPDLPVVLTSGYSHVLAEGGTGSSCCRSPIPLRRCHACFAKLPTSCASVHRLNREEHVALLLSLYACHAA
ncbi:response regulator [Microvirga sp. Mcv34]|uniref:response regulator n=1 Tax=Microvirga sp. Mcv34 TaxID=2926016 RepID=UPI003967D21D